MLSLHTNNALLAAQSATERNSKNLSKAQTRLSTGYRVNSAADDAAGLQIATRLQAQGSGMTTAMKNTQNSISMLQTADGALEEVSNMLERVSALAIQAADASGTQADRNALNEEYVTLSQQILQAVNETPYAGKPVMRYVFDAAGTLDDAGTLGKGAVNFQVGAASAETISANFQPAIGTLNSALYYAIDQGNLYQMPQDGPDTELTTTAFANALIDRITIASKAASALRSQLGATVNQLQSAFNNLSTMQTNTSSAQGAIVDTDFASESAAMAQGQMLMQASTSMLKQSNSVTQLVMSLIQ